MITKESDTLIVDLPTLDLFDVIVIDPGVGEGVALSGVAAVRHQRSVRRSEQTRSALGFGGKNGADPTAGPSLLERSNQVIDDHSGRLR